MDVVRVMGSKAERDGQRYKVTFQMEVPCDTADAAAAVHERLTHYLNGMSVGALTLDVLAYHEREKELAGRLAQSNNDQAEIERYRQESLQLQQQLHVLNQQYAALQKHSSDQAAWINQARAIMGV